MQFTSHRPNLDPEPWRLTLAIDGYPEVRASEDLRFVGGAAVVEENFDPRPEFDHTRDPYPVLAGGVRVTRELGLYIKHWQTNETEWKPRHDQYDVPVNPILAAFRADPHCSITDRARDYLLYLVQYPGEVSKRYSLEEIDHARRVLSKLVSVYKET